jgi:hypothetical protein
MMKGGANPFQQRLMAAAAQHAQVLISVPRRQGTSTALADIAREEAAAGGRVLILSMCERDALEMIQRVGSEPRVICLPQENALPADQYPATCVLIDDAGHMDPTIFFKQVVPLLQKRDGIRLVCVGEDIGLLHSLNQIGGHFQKVNLE